MILSPLPPSPPQQPPAPPAPQPHPQRASMCNSYTPRYFCFYRCVSVRGVLSQHALQVVSQHALQQVSGGGIPACLAGFQVHTQGESLGGSAGGVSRPTPKGEVEGDLVQVHSQGGGGAAPGGLWRLPP